MLVQLVRPLVRTQVQMLTQAQSAGAKLMGMVAQWLSYLGIQAEVTQLETTGDKIQVSLRVGKPEQCTETEWQQILDNLSQDSGGTANDSMVTYRAMTGSQQSKVHRLLASVLQASGQDSLAEWHSLRSRLTAMGMEPAMVNGIQAALKAPMPMALLVEQLEPEVAAFVLSKAINIALIDRQINSAEDSALKTLLNALDTKPISSDPAIAPSQPTD